MKLCLGTVQFGTRYGIQNAGQPSVDDCVKIMDYAVHNGVDYLDTAAVYGTAELVVGELFKRGIVRRDEIQLCTKISIDFSHEYTISEYKRMIEDSLRSSLERLGTDYVDTCLFHQAEAAYHPAALEGLFELRRGGALRHCGVSVYEPQEAMACIACEWVDIIQIPASIFDQRMLKAGVFDKSLQRGDFDIHSRSAFVQGLIMMREENIPDTIAHGGARNAVRRLNAICSEYGLSKMELAIQYIKHMKSISHLVFGVDNLPQLKEYIQVFQRERSSDELRAIADNFRDMDPMIYMPSLWKQ